MSPDISSHANPMEPSISSQTEELAPPSRVSIKLFVGYLLPPDLRHHFHKSASWRQAQIAWQSDAPRWIELQHQGKHYFGRYLDQPELTIKELKTIEQEIIQVLQQHKDGFTQEVVCSVFPQLFIG